MRNDEDWKEAERHLIQERRRHAFNTTCDESKPPKHLVGLALSGGGIRSALYNDGFLQGLSHRGLLRYVDYLSSVSGGGYIAGHLIAQSKNAIESQEGATSLPPVTDDPTAGPDPKVETQPAYFHDDAARWPLGRNPESGKVASKRLAGIGGYLSRPLELLPAYLWSCFFSSAFYLGTAGIVATVVALIWRSFDDPTFRVLYMDVLGIHIGNELLIAFIPFLILLFTYVFAEALISFLRLLCGFHLPLPEKIHRRFRTVSLLLLVLACLTSVAIFLGNGLTNINANAGSTLYLNHYAQWLAVIAGTIQVLVFFGSDRLFRSEREEAKSWQKHLQVIISVGVTLLLIFSIVHWMGRENISKFSNDRSGKFVRGDIANWRVVDRVFEDYETSRHTPLWAAMSSMFDIFNDADLNLNPADMAPKEILPHDKWIEALAGRRLFTLLSELRRSENPDEKLDESLNLNHVTPIDKDTWLLTHRFYCAANAYSLAVLGIGKYASLTDRESGKIRQGPKAYIEDGFEEASGPSVIERLYLVTRYLEKQQDSQLVSWNETLAESAFTKYLLSKMAVKPELSSASIESFTKLSESKSIELTENERKTFLTFARQLQLFPANARDGNLSKTLLIAMDERALSQTRDYTNLNRILLESHFPAAIRRMSIPSTLVVPPYDQQARRTWLGFWLLLTTIGAVGGMTRYRVASVFNFYRRQIGANFLTRSDNPAVSAAETSICDLKPTADGMPYPLLLAAAMEPVTVNGSYKVNCSPFVFSPKYAGDFDSKNRIDSLQCSLHQGNGKNTRAVSLGDAVTLSGAAVSPLMTNNRCLSILVDFFNTGLGKQVYRTDRSKEDSEKQNGPLAWFFTALLTFAFALAIYSTTSNLVFAFLALVLGIAVGYCLIHETGSPHFLRLLLAPREIRPGIDSQNTSYSFYVADGGFCDYLGVSTLLTRRCDLIVVSDAGANVGNDHLGTLAKMCEKSSLEMGIRFLDLDHEAPIDFGRLDFGEKRLVHQPYLCMRIRYPDPEPKEGLLIYCQMAITEQDPIEIKQIRNRFPSFPDEPTVNQFYTDDQVSAYQSLGYHIACRLCRELERWDFTKPPEIDESGSTLKSNTKIGRFIRALRNLPTIQRGDTCNELPHFDVVHERLLTAYRLACHEEIAYRKDDIFTEAVWPVTCFAFPSFSQHVAKLAETKNRSAGQAAQLWLRIFEQSADVRSAYRMAVLEDINVMGIGMESFTATLWFEFRRVATSGSNVVDEKQLLAAHLAAIATACQEVHRGRPHAIFQIGGRQKLIDLCVRIATVIFPVCEPSSEDKNGDEHLRNKFDQVIAEITEFNRSVFQGGEHVTSISFSQCLAVMFGRMVRERTESPDFERVAARARAAHKNNVISQQTESQMLMARRDLDEGIRNSNMNQILDTLVKLWYYGYFHVDTKSKFLKNSSPTFSFPGFRKIVSQLSNATNEVLVERWMQLYGASPRLRKIVREAVALDVANFDSTSECHIAVLWSTFHKMAKSVNDKFSDEALLSAHIAVIASAFPSISVSADVEAIKLDQQKIIEFSANVAKLIRVSETGDADKVLEENLRQLVKLLRSLDPAAAPYWSEKSKASFALCMAALWGNTSRADRVYDDLNFNVADARDAFLEKRINLKDLEKYLSDEKNDLHAVRALAQIWYFSFFNEEDQTPLLDFEQTDSSDVRTTPI